MDEPMLYSFSLRSKKCRTRSFFFLTRVRWRFHGFKPGFMVKYPD